MGRQMLVRGAWIRYTGAPAKRQRFTRRNLPSSGSVSFQPASCCQKPKGAIPFDKIYPPGVLSFTQLGSRNAVGYLRLSSSLQRESSWTSL